MIYKYLHKLTALLLLILLGSGNAILAQTFTSQNLNYEVNDDGPYTVSVTGHVDGTAASGELTLVSEVPYNGHVYTVTRIGSEAFESCFRLTGSLRIPNSVTIIENYAFSGCSGFTGSLIIPNSVTIIDYEAFSLCGFTGSLTIPNSVTRIGYSAFYYCQGFTSLVIGGSVNTIDGLAFAECEHLTSVEVRANIPPTLEADFGFPVFMDVPVETLVVPYGCQSAYEDPEASGWIEFFTTIVESEYFYEGDYRYQHTTSMMADEVTVAGHKFSVYASGDLIIPETVTHLEVTYNVTEIADWAFYNCNATGSIVIPNTVTRIGESAFEDVECQGTLTLGNHLVEIGYGAFSEAIYLSGELIIPNSVTTIGEYAFCSSRFTRLVIGESVTDIGNYAFRFVGSGTGLNRVEILAVTPPTLGGNGVFGGALNENLIVPCGCIPVYQASEWNTVFTNIYQNCEAVEETGENVASVYPNPSNGLLKIEAENLRNISIFNSIGQKMFESPVSGNEFEYNFGGANGMYLIRVETDKGIETRKVTIMW